MHDVAAPRRAGAKGATRGRAHATLVFTPPPPDAAGVGHSADDLAIVLTSLVGRLTADNASLAWGSRLDELGAPAPTCSAAANGCATPLFAITPGSVALGGAGAPLAAAVRDAAGAAAPTSLTLRLTPVSPLAAYSTLRHAFSWQPNMTRALADFPDAPLLWLNGSAWDVPPPLRRRQLQLSQELTGDSREQFWSQSIGGWDWYYGGSPGVARTSPVAIAPGTPTSELGCFNCYAHFDVSVHASLLYETGFFSFNLMKVGAYVQGTADVRGTVIANSPALSGTSSVTLLNRAHIGTISVGILAFSIPVVSGYVGVDVDVRSRAASTARSRTATRSTSR